MILISINLECENNRRLLTDIDETLLLYKITDFALNDLIGKKDKNQMVDQNKLFNFVNFSL